MIDKIYKRMSSEREQIAERFRSEGAGEAGEFLYLLMNPQGRENVEKIAADVIDNLARAISVGTKQLTVRPSIGIAIYPEGGIDGEALIQNADAAMYRAKKGERGYAVHEPLVGQDQPENKAPA